jgi:hypothetical protein
MSDIEVEFVSNPDKLSRTCAIVARYDEYRALHNMRNRLEAEIAEKMAQKFVEEHYDEITAELSLEEIRALALTKVLDKLADKVGKL